MELKLHKFCNGIKIMKYKMSPIIANSLTIDRFDGLDRFYSEQIFYKYIYFDLKNKYRCNGNSN